MAVREDRSRAELGARLRAERVRASVTQREIAERAGVSAKYLSRIELGQVTPSLYVAARVALAVGVSLDSLVGGPIAKPSPRRFDRLARLLRDASDEEVARIARIVREVLR